ncbi:hypothetical protein J0910_01805 [Nocardiopsis sp. CNT-189]|uniref:anti-sigma factor family protein n=1 Tax=Nocardiopsis oceanisediminis TaxID=2816862 RepID=UPI003B3760B4
MTSHVDAETLALSAEGLLDGDDESSVRAHVAECADCAARREALSEVSLALSEAPVPPLPDSVARRLDEVIGAEAERRRAEGDAYPAQDEGDPDDTATQLRRARARARAAAPGTAESNVVPFRPRRTGRWLPYIAAAAAAVFVAGAGAAVMRGFLSGPASDGAAAPRSEPGGPAAIQSYRPLTAESGTSYTETGLAAQAGRVLADAGPHVGSGTGAESPQEGGRIGTLPAAQPPPAELSSCITGLSAASEDDEHPPDLVDVAEYAAAGAPPAPAWVMYYPAEGGTVEVEVVSAECSEGSASSSVLARTTVDAP